MFASTALHYKLLIKEVTKVYPVLKISVTIKSTSGVRYILIQPSLGHICSILIWWCFIFTSTGIAFDNCCQSNSNDSTYFKSNCIQIVICFLFIAIQLLLKSDLVSCDSDIFTIKSHSLEHTSYMNRILFVVAIYS